MSKQQRPLHAEPRLVPQAPGLRVARGRRTLAPPPSGQSASNRERTLTAYDFYVILAMSWMVRFVPEFVAEFQGLAVPVQTELLAQAKVIERFGPQTGRPRVDTLKGSRHANMKELRFDADGGVWRVAFAFDRAREAIVLIAGDKSGGSEKRFYATLIAKADARFDRHLMALKARAEITRATRSSGRGKRR